MDAIKQGTMVHQIFDVLSRKTALDVIVSANLARELADAIMVHQAPDQLTMIRKVEHAASELADARELITNLRTMLTQQAQKVEDLERKAYQDKLVRDQLVAALKPLAYLAKPMEDNPPTDTISLYFEGGLKLMAGDAVNARSAMAAAGVVL